MESGIAWLLSGKGWQEAGDAITDVEPSPVIIRRILPALLFIVSLLLCISPIRAQDTPESRIDAVLATPLFKNAIVGVRVKSLEDGRTIYERNADFALMPASNMKILTSVISAARLGLGFRFTTSLYRTGEITRDGELKSDLYIKGSGDPSLSTLDLFAMAQQLRAVGVKKFKGKIIADATIFEDRPLGEGWEWDDEPFYYQAQVSGLNCDENVVLFTVKPGSKAGDNASIEIGSAEESKAGIAATRYLAVRNSVRTSAADVPASVGFDRSRARNEAVLSGTIPVGGKPATELLTVEEPALYTATRLFDCLAAAGIDVPKPDKRQVEKGILPEKVVSLASHESKTLSGLLADFLKPSDNLYGECLLKTLGLQKNHVGTWDGGANIVRELLTEWGVDPSGLTIADGSGLSRRDNVTPRLLVELLMAADTKLPAESKAAFENGLPIGGVDGTLRNRFKNTPAQGNVHAKTGSLTGVSSLSGYMTTAAGERLVFSILMNHFNSGGSAAQARAAQDAIVLALMETPKPTK